MPMYDYKCGCGKEFTKLLKIADYQTPQMCNACGQIAGRVIMPTAVRVDYPAYICPVTEKLIDGKRAHKENLARTGCRVLEPGEREASDKFRAKREAEFDSKVEATAAEFVTNLPTKKREQLAVELDSGLDCSVTRSTVSKS